MDWYKQSRAAVVRHYGADDADLFCAVLAATSANTTVRANTTLAMKAWQQLQSGQQFTGFLGTVIANLDRVRNGEELSGIKISAFYRALCGDENSVVVDRWMARAYGIWTTVTPKVYETVARKIRLEAAANGMTATQFQAWLWARVRGAGESFADILDAKFRQGRLF